MVSRLLPLLVFSVALAFACGPRAHSNEAATRTAGPSGAKGPALASSLDVRVDSAVDSDVGFALHVTNQGRKSLELTFPDGQTHELVVLDTDGREVWRWSAGRMFTQALQNRVLERRETVSYDAAWRPASAHGTFTVVASLRSENHPIERRMQFTLP